MPHLSVTLLVDNATLIDRYFTAEPGLSFSIETSEKKILFDLGYSGVFLANAENLGIDLLDLDYVVLSHGHIDHTGGLVPLMRRYMEVTIEHHSHKLPIVIAHPHCFYPRPMSPLADIGALVDEAQLRWYFPVTLSTSLVWQMILYSSARSRVMVDEWSLKSGLSLPRRGTSLISCWMIPLSRSNPTRDLSFSPVVRTPVSVLSSGMPGRSAASSEFVM